MSRLRVTLIDVGWGDSLLLESEDTHKVKHYALIDSNDSAQSRSSRIFLRRFFERQNVPINPPVFEWVLLTHVHADHGQGLKRLLKEFGAQAFWYPVSSSKAVFFTDLLRFVKRSSNVGGYGPIDDTHPPFRFGDAQVQILWPPRNSPQANENNNSVVVALTLNNVSFVLTGDAEADGVWTRIARQIPPNTSFFKVPHHGSSNGMFDAQGNKPWLPLPAGACTGISSHVLPFPHPSAQVIQELSTAGVPTYRTDQRYHITVETDGTNTTVQ